MYSATSFDEDVSMQTSETMPFVDPHAAIEDSQTHPKATSTHGHGAFAHVNDISEDEYYA